MCRLLYFLLQKMFQKAGALLLLNMVKCHFLRMVCLPVALSPGFLILWRINFLGNFFFSDCSQHQESQSQTGKGLKKTTLCLSCSLHCQLMSVAHISVLLHLAVTVTAGRSLPIWTGGNNCTVVAPDSSSRNLHLGLHGKGRECCSNPLF